jgi:FtsZ-binding cell division protein ZapB
LQQQIDELKTLNNDTANTVLNQNSIITSLQNSVDTLNNKQDALQGELSALNSLYAAQEKDSANIKNDISKLSDTVNNDI